MRRRILLSLAVLAWAAAPGRAQEIRNGGFEENPPGMAGWLELGGVAAAPGGAPGSAHSARLGPSAGLALQGGSYRGSSLWQSFTHASAPVPCVIELDYRTQGGAAAYVEISGAAGVQGAFLSPALLFDRVWLAYPASGPMQIGFTVIEAGGSSVLALLQVDNIAVAGSTPAGRQLALQPNWLASPATPLERAMLELRELRGATSSSITSPAGYLATEGDSMHGHVLFSKPWVVWQQIDGTLRGTTGTVRELGFRRDFATASQSAFSARQLEIEILLAHGDVQRMSSEPARNYVGTPATVFTKKTVLAPAWTQQPASGTVAPWDFVLPLDQTWPYDGTGDLLWEVRVTANSGAPYARFINYPVDAQSAAGSFAPSTQPGVSIGQGCVTPGQGTGPFTLTQTLSNSRLALALESGVSGAPAGAAVTLYMGTDDPAISVSFLCTALHALPMLAPALGHADANGAIARVVFGGLPYRAGLVGLALHTQALAIDITQPFVPISLSNGVRLVVPNDPVYPTVGHLFHYRDSAGGAVLIAGPYAGGAVARLRL